MAFDCTVFYTPVKQLCRHWCIIFRLTPSTEEMPIPHHRGAARAETEIASDKAVRQGQGTSPQQKPQAVGGEARRGSNTAKDLLGAQHVSVAIMLR